MLRDGAVGAAAADHGVIAALLLLFEVAPTADQQSWATDEWITEIELAIAHAGAKLLSYSQIAPTLARYA